MSDMDPQTTLYFGYTAALVGLVMFVWGVVAGRAKNDGKQLVLGGAGSGDKSNQDAIARALISPILQGGGLGMMAWAAICYFANQYDWAFKAGLGVFVIGELGGSLVGFTAIKAMRQQ